MNPTDDINIEAPFTPDEIASLNAYQHSSAFHPFTCPHRGDHHHIWRDGDKDLATLEAKTHGWECPQCGYTQTWAYPWMANWEWRTIIAI